ncbi:VOC family protein [Streptomyces sp. NPDC003077]|uniref:VOC family protein n=1 Tax=Streptomyces sp. NPDC003077 TaxID=3154443 RepID=UPI0033A4D454
MAETKLTCVPGAPSWVNLITGDLDAATRFYGELLGWRFEEGPDRWGPFTRALAGEGDGVAVAGLNASARKNELPVSWTVYFGTEDADATANGLRERGGTVAVGPLNFDAGRIAMTADPAGARFGLWECHHPCTQGEPHPVVEGAPTWFELSTRDAFESARFYGDLFGWDDPEYGRFEIRWEDDRVLLRLGDRDVVGLHGGAVEAAADPHIRPRWNVHFQVADVDATAEAAQRLGGAVVGEPVSQPNGRVARLRDTEGALFHVIAPAP